MFDKTRKKIKDWATRIQIKTKFLSPPLPPIVTLVTNPVMSWMMNERTGLSEWFYSLILVIGRSQTED